MQKHRNIRWLPRVPGILEVIQLLETQSCKLSRGGFTVALINGSGALSHDINHFSFCLYCLSRGINCLSCHLSCLSRGINGGVRHFCNCRFFRDCFYSRGCFCSNLHCLRQRRRHHLCGCAHNLPCWHPSLVHHVGLHHHAILLWHDHARLHHHASLLWHNHAWLHHHAILLWHDHIRLHHHATLLGHHPILHHHSILSCHHAGLLHHHHPILAHARIVLARHLRLLHEAILLLNLRAEAVVLILQDTLRSAPQTCVLLGGFGEVLRGKPFRTARTRPTGNVQDSRERTRNRYKLCSVQTTTVKDGPFRGEDIVLRFACLALVLVVAVIGASVLATIARMTSMRRRGLVVLIPMRRRSAVPALLLWGGRGSTGSGVSIAAGRGRSRVSSLLKRARRLGVG
mmetsp:Transcript_5843/g.12192  ORF Transcript_5843/g.12192 Transcript_5843/m.12192 type:complete len:400 (+) Transcript_5843:531-1730(+)